MGSDGGEIGGPYGESTWKCAEGVSEYVWPEFVYNTHVVPNACVILFVVDVDEGVVEGWGFEEL